MLLHCLSVKTLIDWSLIEGVSLSLGDLALVLHDLATACTNGRFVFLPAAFQFVVEILLPMLVALGLRHVEHQI